MLPQRMPSALFELYSIQCSFDHGRYDCWIWFHLHAGHFLEKALENDPSMSQRLEFYLSTCSRRHHSCHSRLYQNHSESMYITTVSSEVHTSHRISHNFQHPWNFQGPVCKCGSWTSTGVVKTDARSCGALSPRWLVCFWVHGTLGKWMCRQPAQAQRAELCIHVSQLLRIFKITLWSNLLPTFLHLPTMSS